MSKKILERPETCAICFEKLEESKSLECGHWLHIVCVQKHFRPECPLCRAPLNIEVTGKYPNSNITFEETIPTFEETILAFSDIVNVGPTIRRNVDDMPSLEDDNSMDVDFFQLFRSGRHFSFPPNILGNVIERGYEEEENESYSDRGYTYREEASDYDEENPNGDEW